MAACTWNVIFLFACLAVHVQQCVSNSYMPKYDMHKQCGKTLDLETEGVTSGKLELIAKYRSRSWDDCWVVIQAPAGSKLVVTFLHSKVNNFLKCKHYVEIMDGWENGTSLTSKLCEDNDPEESYSSSKEVISVHFHHDSSKEHHKHAFTIIFTVFHTGICLVSDEFKCDNGFCIDADLKCNGYNNCGDKSDSCELTSTSLLGVVGVGVLVILICIAACLFIRRRRRMASGGRVLKTNDPVTVQLTTTTQSYGQPYAQQVMQPPQGQPPPGYSYSQPPYQAGPPPAYQGIPSNPAYPPQQAYPPPGYPEEPSRFQPPPSQFQPPSAQFQPPPSQFQPPPSQYQPSPSQSQPPPSQSQPPPLQASAPAPPAYQEKPPLT